MNCGSVNEDQNDVNEGMKSKEMDTALQESIFCEEEEIPGAKAIK